MFDALFRYLGSHWLVRTISRYIAIICPTISTSSADIEKFPVTLDEYHLPFIDRFERCVGDGESASCGPFVHLAVTYNDGEKRVVQCPQSFFLRWNIIQEELNGILTPEQWKRMNGPISYCIHKTVREEKRVETIHNLPIEEVGRTYTDAGQQKVQVRFRGDLGWTAVQKALVEGREDFLRAVIPGCLP